jgi:hypothetical protein
MSPQSKAYLRPSVRSRMSIMSTSELRSAVEANGFATLEGVLSSTTVSQLIVSLQNIGDHESARKRDGVFAVRNLQDVSAAIRELADSKPVRDLVEPVLGENCFPVRGILFDKIPDANWKVPWHQDVTIAVQERIEAEGFGPWSTKAEVLHVQPPAEVLERMISVRIHLDDCSEDNGALRVIPGSHLKGRLPEKQISHIREQAAEHVCVVGMGGVLLMRPLLLHASSPSRVPKHRRVVHLDFASMQLPNGMRWLSELN